MSTKSYTSLIRGDITIWKLKSNDLIKIVRFKQLRNFHGRIRKSIILKQNTMFSVVWTRDEITRKALKLDVGPLTNGKIR